jgi:hypothetical protein
MWNDSDWTTMERRTNHFVEAGCPEDDAVELAYSMMVRDRENTEHVLDDRRVCFECKGLNGRNCLFVKDKLGKSVPPLRFILQRCPEFQLKGKK